MNIKEEKENEKSEQGTGEGANDIRGGLLKKYNRFKTEGWGVGGISGDEHKCRHQQFVALGPG